MWLHSLLPCRCVRLLVAARKLRCFLSRHWGAQVYASLCRDASEGGEPAPPLWRAFTYELCAGLVDKAMTLPEIAAEEVGALPRRLDIYCWGKKLGLVERCPSWLLRGWSSCVAYLSACDKGRSASPVACLKAVMQGPCDAKVVSAFMRITALTAERA